MSSTRLPGKSVEDVGGEPMLALLLRRLARARELERILVATSTEPGDDPVEEVARKEGFAVYRGALDDVLGRFASAAAGHAGPLARVTGDCPLIDAAVVDEVVRLFHRTPGCEYASNIEPARTYPIGLDTEVISADVLKRIAARSDDPYEREHVTMPIRKDLSSFRTATLTFEEQLGDLRWTVDTLEDLAFVRKVVARLGARRYVAGLNEILTAVRAEPSLATFHGRRG
jgi:spore coat polysaccharide biosynthesis protein SpsF (cytidylyltransferase family)